MINLLADQNLYRLQEFLPEDFEITYYDPLSEIPPLHGFDAWLLRTETKVNKSTFPDLPEQLKFIGTGSSGSDHVDMDLMNSNDIRFEDSKGCNARAVAEYVMISLLLWKEEKGTDLQSLTFGIIGAGAVGTQVAAILSDFDLNYKLYDPPREERESDFSSCSLEEVLSCEVLTFHVPFTTDGEHPTHHWLDEEKLSGRNFKMIITAARGGVIKETAVSHAMNKGAIEELVVDVWEQEPDFDPEFSKKAFIATPHIAGYSEQAKLNASRFVCEKMCTFFGVESPDTDHLYVRRDEKLAHIHYSLKDLILRLDPIKEYDAALRDLTGREDKAALFAKLRVDRPYRFQYPYLNLEKELLEQFDELKRLGVKEYHIQ